MSPENADTAARRMSGPSARNRSGSHELRRIESEVETCRACPRLVAHREHVGSVKRRAYRDETYWAKAVPSFGDESARLLVIGLAPAAHGANRTGRMFTGDSSGEWLYRALFRARFCNRAESVARNDGLILERAYITAVAHCAPPDNKPMREEIARCSPFLEREFEIVAARARRGRPVVFLALGGIAFAATLRSLDAIGIKTPRPRPRFGHAMDFAVTDSIRVIASYHPSRQNTHTGRLTEPMFDEIFARCRELLG